MFDSILEAHKATTALRHSLTRRAEFADENVFEMLASLQQVLDIAKMEDQQANALRPEDISDIGERGLGLLDSLVASLAAKNLVTEKQDIEQVALVIAQWVISHHGVLHSIQSIVDGLAYLANAIHDKTILAQLACFMGQVISTCDVIIKHDLDNSDPARPWRVLNINRGIVATRSHDPDVMMTVYTDMIRNIPMDAPAFFAEGMSEMMQQNYPEPVREVVQEFYERTKLPVIH